MNVESYIHGVSIFHRLDSRPKLLMVVLLVISFLFSSSPVMLTAVLAFSISSVVIAVGCGDLWKIVKRVLPIMIILFLCSPFQCRWGRPLISFGSFVLVTEEGLLSVYGISTRLLSVTLILMVLLMTTRNEELIGALRWYKLPYSGAIVISMVLRFIPHLGSLFESIRASMSLRLTEGKRGYPILPSVISLLSASVKMMPLTASALEERGFGRKERVEYRVLRRPRHYLLQWLICLAVSAVAVLLAWLY